jgi:hypothetical protein
VKLLRFIAAHLEVISNSISSFNWSGTIHLPPKRGGKRHHLIATIKERIAEFSNGTFETAPEQPK